MKQSIILGIGTGRCGTASLAKILNQQPDVRASYEERPLLPWSGINAECVLRDRFARFRQNGKAKILGDVASFYLPYLETAIAIEPDIRVVCLRRPREEVVASFCEWLDQIMPLPTNHWARHPAVGWHHDLDRTRIYPHYDIQDREEGIRRYWDEYYGKVEELIRRYPQHLSLFDTYEALNTEAGLRALLAFVGIQPERQVLAVGTHVNGKLDRPKHRWARRSSGDPMDSRRCAILVPVASPITPPCARALQELERRGYEVRRVDGFTALDQARSQMATEAILDGYEETMWIDGEVDFHPDSVDRLRSHRLPIACGICSQTDKHAIAGHVMPETPRMIFGKEGGLTEILYAGAGFLLVRREVYLAVQDRLQLPMCNERFGLPLVPFFQPMLHRCEDGYWYLPDEHAFSERVRQAGLSVVADTTIRLWRIGYRAFGWEDAGTEGQRFDTLVLNFTSPWEAANRRSADRDDMELEDFARQNAWPAQRPAVPLLSERKDILLVTVGMLSRLVPKSVRLIVILGAGTGETTSGLLDWAPNATVVAIDRWQEGSEHLSTLALHGQMSARYQRFLAQCWDQRHMVIPIRADSADGLQRVAQARLQPDVVYVGGDREPEVVLGDLQSVIDIFPQAIIVGDHWEREDVRKAVERAAADCGMKYETAGGGCPGDLRSTGLSCNAWAGSRKRLRLLDCFGTEGGGRFVSGFRARGLRSASSMTRGGGSVGAEFRRRGRFGVPLRWVYGWATTALLMAGGGG